MKFALTRVTATIGMLIAAGSAQAVLTSSNTLSIQVDAVTSPTNNTSASAAEWYVSSDGPLLDSFFTMVSTSQTKQAVGTQFAYLYNGADLTLNGATQSSIATFEWYGQTGGFETLGTGISILSASGDTATVNMSGWNMPWNGVLFIPMGTGAWSAGYTSGVGNITCAVGSGCAVGSSYTLTYTATVPAGGPAGFGLVKYYLELHGTVGPSPIPEASTYGMMLAGLGLVGVMARRRRQAKA